MAEARVDRLAVLLHLAGEECPVGTLAWSRTTRTAAFEFDRRFAARGLAISPFHLPAGPDVRTAPPTPFDGLFGVFADSLPDGWGRLLLDRKLRALDTCVPDAATCDLVRRFATIDERFQTSR